jgi:hypothetical protein
MADVNFPDVLGAITGGPRAAFDLVQAAAAVRPRPPRTGQAFDVVLLLQNTCSERVGITATLALPEADARRQRGRFICPTPSAPVVLQPAEVGALFFPVLTLADAAPAPSYRVRLTLEARPAQKPARIRKAQGGVPFDTRDLPASALPAFEALKALNFNAGKARANGFELEFGLAAGDGRPTPAEQRRTRFYSLWRTTTATQAVTLLHIYGPLLRGRLLGQLRRSALVPALTAATSQRFAQAQYPLREAEAALIAKLMGLLLEYAAPDDTGHGFIAAGEWAIAPLLNRPFDLSQPVDVPHWLRGLLREVEREPKAALNAVEVLAGPVYDDLLCDAVRYGFDLVHGATGEDVGSPAERNAYATDLLHLLNHGGPLDFSRAYLPLIMGGMLVNELLLLPEEKPADLLHGVAAAVEEREPALPPEEAPLLELTNVLLDRTARKYGFWVLP